MILQTTSPELYVGLPEGYRRKVLCPISQFTLEEITESVLKLYDVTPEEVFSKSRKGAIVNARMIIIYLTCQTEKYSLQEIGRKTGGRDHSTVIYNRDTVIDRMEVDKVFKAEVDRAASIVCARWDAVQAHRISEVTMPEKRIVQQSFELQFY